MNNRRIAIITGISLILMAVIAGFSIGYAYSEFYKPEQLENFNGIILNNQVLYKNMLIGILIILILDLLVSYTLYKYFENDNRKISLASAIIRMIYTLIFGIATYYLTKNLNINEITSQSINTNFQSFELIWNSGLIIFGFHILLIGVLMKLHRRIPKILWYLTLIAGVSYIFVHILKLTSPNSEFVTSLEMILALPMALGELGLAIWLLIKGGKKSNR
jgi:magnesium-transporting ATPase (P-type)